MKRFPLAAILSVLLLGTALQACHCSNNEEATEEREVEAIVEPGGPGTLEEPCDEEEDGAGGGLGLGRGGSGGGDGGGDGGGNGGGGSGNNNGGGTTPGQCQNPPCLLTVTFDKNGGDTEAVPQTKTVKPPAKTIDALPVPPTKAGHGFREWNTAPDGSGTVFTAATLVTASMTVYAQWTQTTFTVTFDKNGGTAEANPRTKLVVKPATTIDKLPEPPMSPTHRFRSWNKAANGTGAAFDANTFVDADITVYAQWEQTHVIVNFNGNGGTPEFPSKIVIKGGYVTPLPDAMRPNHRLLGWTTTPNGDTPFNTQTQVNGPGPLTVYAKWEQTHVTVNFYGNGGTPTLYSTAVKVGGFLYTLPDATRPNHRLVGWTTTPNGDTPFNTKTQVNAPGPVNVYAKWEQTHVVVNFNGNGGTPTFYSTTVKVGGYVDALPDATRLNHRLVGWTTTPDGDTPFTTQTPVNGPGPVTVYAKWQQTHVVVNFNGNGGTPTFYTTTVKVGGYVDALPGATRAYHRLVGWTTTQNGNTPFTTQTPVNGPGPLTVYAKWEQTHFTVTFDGKGGSLEFSSKTVEKGSVIGQLPTATRAGFIFNGWKADDGTVFTANSTVVRNMDVYAQWTAKLGSIIRNPMSEALTPLETEDYSERLGLFFVEVSGFANEDDAESVGLDLTGPQGLSLGETSLFEEGTKTFTVTVDYDGQTAFPEASAAIQLNGLTHVPEGYAPEDDVLTTCIPIRDGKARHRSIPVHPGNKKAFEGYAKTPEGRTRHFEESGRPAAPEGGSCQEKLKAAE